MCVAPFKFGLRPPGRHGPGTSTWQAPHEVSGEAALTYRILIIDDHELVCKTIAWYISQSSGMDVTTATRLTEAVDLLAKDHAFDLIVLDYAMPGGDRLMGLAQIKSASDGKPVALMSGIATRSIAFEAIKVGAVGFMSKTMPASSFVNALQLMIHGERYAPVRWMMEAETVAAPDPLIELLSKRERTVLKCLLRGQTNRQIAATLAVTEETVKFHVKNIRLKLGARNRTHAALIARNARLAH